MTKQATGKKNTWVHWWLRVYWGIATVMVLMFAAQYVGAVSGAFAANENAVASTTSATFKDYVCSVTGYIGGTVEALAILTIIIAGVIYASSMGQSGGELSISLAKQMIVAALTGLLLFYMGTFFIGQCGSGGGFIAWLLNGSGQ